MPSKSAYGPNPNAGRNRNNARARGWGSGWPNCQYSKFKTVAKAGVRVTVHEDIAPLVSVLLEATEKTFDYNVKSGQTWGAACRAIRGTRIPSNHSWGLAVDINSLANPMQSRFKSDMPPKMVAMWERCGFYWGGRYQNRPDAMHFEYIGRPSDVAKDLAQALTYLLPLPDPTPQPTPPDKEWQVGDGFPGPDAFKIGKRHPAVTVLGQRLKHHGFDKHHDGNGYQPGPVFTKYDRENVQDFQRCQGWTGKDADGFPGRTTWDRLYDEPKPEPAPKPKGKNDVPEGGTPAKDWPVLSRGEEGEAVALLQRFLGVEPANGTFGRLTEREVRDYQQMHRLEVDGVVGEKTWKKILSGLDV